MGFNVNGNTLLTTTISPEGSSIKYNQGDGSSSANPAKSGWHLRLTYPSKTTGWYWIQSESMPSPLQMYVDMVEDGGGYDFYFITGGP